MRFRFLTAAASVFALQGLSPLQAAGAPPTVFLDQGPNWTGETRSAFYERDQGAQLIPLPWLLALKQPSGKPFLDDHFSRYGYLPNPDSAVGLPAGFTLAGPDNARIAGMNCAACHTRQITVSGQPYRIDGGPAIVDFQSFLKDLDTAAGAIEASDAAFQPFAKAVLGTSATPAAVAALQDEVKAWYLRYHTLVSRSLPDKPWGPSRLDAVSMIYNRLGGLALGPAPSYLIPDNIQKADAPVRYPFLWNAPIQDKTQWPGFSDNGDDLFALSRNLGEVYGVFGEFHPTKDPGKLLRYDYITQNSANFPGLLALETLVKKIGPPRWPWAIDAKLAAEGERVFDRPQAEGGCVGCHGIKPGAFRGFEKTWATPILDVHTDTREYAVLGRSAKTGVMQGAFLDPFKPLPATSPTFSILATAVGGAILQALPAYAATAPQPAPNPPGLTQFAAAAPPALTKLKGDFHDNVVGAPAPPPPAYESRVMQGIWAAAPYLHNGSVPTLADLLKPAAARPKSFKVGPAYDIASVGLATEQTVFDYTLNATGCDPVGIASGDSNCGHDFGTTLPDPDKKALLEYLKTL